MNHWSNEELSVMGAMAGVVISLYIFLSHPLLSFAALVGWSYVREAPASHNNKTPQKKRRRR